MATSPITTALSSTFDLLHWSISIVSELATEEPLHELALNIQSLDDYDSDGFESPEPCLIHASNGTGVTIRDVVTHLSAYMISHKSAILE
jgi:hypothetical protein